MEKNNIVDTFFRFRQEDLLEEMVEDQKSLRNQLKQLSKKKLLQCMNMLPDEYKEVKKHIYEYIEDLTNDYEIKMAYYDKKYYKQGFRDAIMLQSSLKGE